MSDAAPTLWQRLWYTRLRDALRGRFDARLDWRRVIAEADLPGELAEVVAKTVRSTRLWRGEKVDVARELIAHFHDGLDAGRASRQLIESFGDPRQAARLVRRAKKRGRSLVWHIWHCGWFALAGLSAIYIVTGLYMLTRRPTVSTDYLAIVNDRALAVPAAERAWPLYRGALLQLEPTITPGESYPNSNIDHIDAKPGDAAWPEIDRLLRDRAAAVDQLRLAARRSGLGFVPSNTFAAFEPADWQLFGVTVTDEDRAKAAVDTIEDRWLVSTLLPNLQQLRTAAMVLAADARRAALDGDAKTALADVEAILDVGRHCQETPFLVCLMVAERVQHTAYDVVREILAKPSQLWSDDELRDLAHSIVAAEIDWHRGFEGERASIYDTLQRLYTDDGDGDGRITDEGLRKIRFMISLLEPLPNQEKQEMDSRLVDLAVTAAAPAGLFGMASRAELVAAYDQFMDRHEADLDRPLWEIEPDSMESGLENWSTFQRLRYLPLTILLPSLSPMRYAVERERGTRDGLLVGIALELYHRQHGAWPATLDELSPRWLPSVPVDRITGEPLRYKIVDGRPVVYSVGVDRDDDGGRPPLGDDGKSGSSLASPNHFQLQPVTDATHDGDWVIWSRASDDR